MIEAHFVGKTHRDILWPIYLTKSTYSDERSMSERVCKVYGWPICNSERGAMCMLRVARKLGSGAFNCFEVEKVWGFNGHFTVLYK